MHCTRVEAIASYRERLTAIKPFRNPPKVLLHIYQPETKITENVFTYLDGVETNLAFPILKTTSRFRETERTLVLQIQY